MAKIFDLQLLIGDAVAAAANFYEQLRQKVKTGSIAVINYIHTHFSNGWYCTRTKFLQCVVLAQGWFLKPNHSFNVCLIDNFFIKRLSSLFSFFVFQLSSFSVPDLKTSQLLNFLMREIFRIELNQITGCFKSTYCERVLNQLLRK